MIKLYTSYYNEPNQERAKELRECLLKNIDNVLIDKIYIIIGNELQVSDVKISDKIIPYVFSSKPTYADYFNLVNDVSEENDVNIISNSDIFFDETLQLISQLKENDCWALSRWEINQDKSNGDIIQSNGDSQDCWIFKGKIKTLEYCNFSLGIMGCDNRIAYEIQKASYEITNPCLSIKTWHLHNTNHRNYNASVRNEKTVVQPPYLTLSLTSL
jgi:hypothetical protein